jgi:hypothetical protein
MPAALLNISPVRWQACRPCRSEIELAGWHGERHEIRDGVYGLRMHHDRDRASATSAIGVKSRCVIRQLLVEAGIDGVRADGAHEQRAPVGRRLGDGICAERATRATAIVDDDRRFEGIAQQLGERPCHDVGRTSGRKGND